MVVNKGSLHYKVWRMMKTDDDVAKPVSACSYIADLAFSPVFFMLFAAFMIILGPIVFFTDKLESWWKSRFPSGVCPHGSITFQ